MVLKLEGYDVQVAHDGAVVLEAARRFRPEVVLLDIGLPGMDGYQLARRLRQDQDLGASIALLVAVTGYAEDEARPPFPRGRLRPPPGQADRPGRLAGALGLARMG